MKIKSILACLLALSLLFSVLSLSAFAVTSDYILPSNYEITYTTTFDDIDYSAIPLGTLQRLTIGDNLVECYQPHTAFSNGPIIFETYGLFTHILSKDTTVNLGGWSFQYRQYLNTSNNNYYCYIDFLLDGVSQREYSFASTTEARTQFRYGFSLVQYNNKSYLAVIFSPLSEFPPSSLSNPNYFPLSLYTDKLTSSNVAYYEYNTPLIFLLDLAAQSHSWSTEVDIGGGQSSYDVFFDSWTTCPNCGSHNISYKSSFLYSGVMVLTGQVGWVFKCRDCGASWKGITSNQQELDLFKKYMSEVDYSQSLIEDSTLPPFTSTPSTVDLPSDVGGIGEYINQVFSALTSFTSSFNSFFSQVFAVLPAPVVGIILLGVGLVVIIGIIKAVRG